MGLFYLIFNRQGRSSQQMSPSWFYLIYFPVYFRKLQFPYKYML